MNAVRVVVVGCGTMGSSHARAYARLEGFTLAADESVRTGTIVYLP
jgi:predicted dehydrogenase